MSGVWHAEQAWHSSACKWRASELQASEIANTLLEPPKHLPCLCPIRRRVHYVAFDLWVARWEVVDARERGVPQVGAAPVPQCMMMMNACPQWRSACSVPRSSCSRGATAAAAQAGAALVLASRAVLRCGVQGSLCQCDAPGGAFALQC